MGAAVEARKAINAEEGVKVSFNDMVVKAVSLALKKHPAVNSAWMDTHIRQNDHVHIGVAVRRGWTACPRGAPRRPEVPYRDWGRGQGLRGQGPGEEAPAQ